MSPNYTLNINGRLVDLQAPKVMGIVNVTPDSFFAGSRHAVVDEVLRTAERMLNEGATFLDIGGYSSRPGAEDISIEEEIRRVTAPLEYLSKQFPETVLSIDTFRQPVAKAAMDCGAHMVNDISGGHLDDQMIPWVGSAQLPYVAMHMRGTPQTMKQLTDYENVVTEVMRYFGQLREKAKAAGIKDLIIDPGFGFAKTLIQNYDLLHNLHVFKQLDCPILVGLSRKSMIYKLLDVTPDEALNGTTVLNTVALLGGAHILRVHDVKAAVEASKLINQLNGAGI